MGFNVSEGQELSFYLEGNDAKTWKLLEERGLTDPEKLRIYLERKDK